MENLAQIEIVSVNHLIIFNWIRREMSWLSIKECHDLSKSKLIDFNGDYTNAIKLYNYLLNIGGNSAKLIINISHDSTGYNACGGYGVEAEIIV